jgi:formylglycine-generating enzyme required for sulfatase activity
MQAPIEIEWIEIPAGEFVMGSLLGKLGRLFNIQEELPQRKVYVPAFQIAKYPVTNAQYKAFIDATGYKPPWAWSTLDVTGHRPPSSPLGNMYLDGTANHPVVTVSWYDAMTFCQWAGCRLPTEIEWEKAARGTDGRRYPWGNRWRKELCNASDLGHCYTTPVGKFSPAGDSPYGVADMVGNGWEWTDSWYDEEHKRRVLRGGGLGGGRFNARCTIRIGCEPSKMGDYFGFRCAK